MAQQARPNVTGHIDSLRAQLTALSSVVRSRPRLTSSSTDASGPRPVWTPGNRSIGMGRPRTGRDELRGTLPSLASLARSRCSAALAPAGYRPIQATGLPDVDVGDQHQRDEHHHLHEAKDAEAAELHGPGEQEDRLDVEDDEEHRDQV